MVGIAQLVEHLVVVQDVAGSNPVTHPMAGGMHREQQRPRKPPIHSPTHRQGFQDTYALPGTATHNSQYSTVSSSYGSRAHPST